MTSDSPKIRHRVPAVFDYSTLIEDAATFYVNNKLFEGWKNVSVSRTMNSLANGFSLTILNKFSVDETEWEIKPGLRGHMHLGKSAVFEGYIDTLATSFSSNTRNLTLQGRSRTADLVDCSFIGAAEFNNLNLEQIATKLCQPFGIKVLVLAPIGDVFSNISIKPSEKIFEVLSRLARQRGVILYTSTHGNLIINTTGSTRAKTELIEGVNILEASASYDNTERFSQYIVKSQNDGVINGLVGTKAEDSIDAEGTATDEGMGRYRPLILVSEAAGDTKASQARAQWEATFRSSKASTFTIKVQGWREKNGDLWDINKLVYLRSRKLGVNDQFLINSVTYTQSEDDARTCQIELVRKDSYQIKPIVSKTKDPLSGLGL